MNIIGISGYYHDSAAALIVDGDIIAAAQEERFTRKKHDPSFPKNAIEYCLKAANLTLATLDHIVFYDKPFLKFERLLETYVHYAPKGFKSFSMAMPVWLREKLFLKDLLIKELKKIEPEFSDASILLFSEHHMSHAASAFYPSPFEEAVVLTMDGVGEWATTSVSIGKANTLTLTKEISFPHSLGLLYSAFTYYTGFKVNAGEYKLMGLAPYGRPIYRDKILNTLLDVKDDGSFRLDQSYFNYCTGLTMTNHKFDQLFGQSRRDAESELCQFHMDIAASIQSVTEHIVLKITRSLRKETGIKNLCLAGGVALNCVANGKILRDKAFENIWIQPAAGDAGGAIGCALTAFHQHLGKPRSTKPTQADSMSGAFLGPSFSQKKIEESLTLCGAVFTTCEWPAVIDKTVKSLEEQKAIGWFQGRMEFGPRALGARSIIGDPRSPDMQKILNLKVKYRESFRPFAPSILEEDLGDWFDMEANTGSPYMLIVSDIKKDKQFEITPEDAKRFGIEKLKVQRSNLPATTHVDYSARIQSVSKKTNPAFYDLIKAFKARTGCPAVINTSFNVRGEPIVCTPEDAYRCFMGTELDVLVIGNCFLKKEDQHQQAKQDYKNNFSLD